MLMIECVHVQLNRNMLGAVDCIKCDVIPEQILYNEFGNVKISGIMEAHIL